MISGKVRIFLLFSYTLPITSVPSLSGQVIIFGVELDSNARLQAVIASRASSHGRQSSDRSRGSRGTLSSQATSCPRLWRSCGWGGRSRRNTGEETSRLMRHFLMEQDHLPRQARDKCKPKMFVENKLMFSFLRGLDGVSILPILRGEPASHRCIGHNFNTEGGIDRALRCGKWKLVQYTGFGAAGCPPGAIGCHAGADQSCGVHNDSGVVTSVCRGKSLLYDLSVDLGERHDLAAAEPAALAMMLENERSWTASIAHSIGPAESDCPASVVPPGIFPPPPPSQL